MACLCRSARPLSAWFSQNFSRALGVSVTDTPTVHGTERGPALYRSPYPLGVALIWHQLWHQRALPRGARATGGTLARKPTAEPPISKRICCLIGYNRKLILSASRYGAMSTSREVGS